MQTRNPSPLQRSAASTNSPTVCPRFTHSSVRSDIESRSDFQPEVCLPREITQQPEDVIGKAIGTGGNRKPNDPREVQSLTVKLFELCNRGIGVCVALEIGNEFFRFVALTNGIGAFFELLGNRGPRLIVLRRVARIVAIDTAADRDFAVAVWTGKVEPQANLVDARVKFL